ncbi:MAG: DUF5801 domain-containing protein [Xanthobacteraceae bacterium]|nr:DUF5801 domain-containing protein [Xanthobacteraceae bacterium]
MSSSTARSTSWPTAEPASASRLYRVTAGNPTTAELVADIATGNPGSGPEELVIFDNALYFSADGPNGRELYRLDSSDNLTLIDIRAGGAGSNSNPTGFVVFGDAMYFSANDGDEGHELFRVTAADPTTAVRVADINPGPSGNDSNPGGFTPFPTSGIGSSDEIDPASLPAVFAPLGGPILAAGQSQGSVVNLSFVPGADEPASVAALALTDATGNDFDGTPSGIFDTATGNQIYLYADPSGLILGRVGTGTGPTDGDEAGDVSFALYIDGNGTLWVAQYLAIQHPDGADPNDLVTLEDAIFVTATIIDFDGDKTIATTSAAIEVNFLDDGFALGTPVARTVDEDGLPNGNNNASPGDAVDDNADGDNDETTATGSLNIAWGVDDFDVADAGGVQDRGSRDARQPRGHHDLGLVHLRARLLRDVGRHARGRPDPARCGRHPALGP